MDDRELDNLLDEIKQHKAAGGDSPLQDDVTPPAPANDFKITEEKTIDDEVNLFPEEARRSDDADSDIDVMEVLSEHAAKKAAEEEKKKPPVDDKKKKIIIAVCAAVAVLVVILIVVFAKGKDKPAPETTAAPASEVVSTTETAALAGKDTNPLTGEKDFNKDAIGKRPMAVVVENEYGTNDYAQQSRPQWGLEDADMVMEGETEFATRLLMFWADYTNAPEKIGPVRSARPPFIRFAELFDGIFIHAGLSHSKGDYVGADTVFKKHNTDHVNLLDYSTGGAYTGNDTSRPTIEHQHYFKGNNAPDLISSKDFRTKLNEDNFTRFKFSSEIKDLSSDKAETVKIKWSDNGNKHGTFTYNEKKGTYTTDDFNSKYGEVSPQFENIIVLFDTTEYIVKHNYKGSGNSETYCEYKLDGGKGMVASNGTYVEIKWEVKDKKIVLTKADGSDVLLNPGKVYIAYASSNHNGSYSVE